MIFMMAWDKLHDVFFIVTGNKENGVTVWALRLEYKTRQAQRLAINLNDRQINR